MKRDCGFTLIELLVSIAIVTLIASVILASLQQARIKSRDANRIANAVQIRTALEMYQTSAGTVRVSGAGYQDTGTGYLSKSGVADYTTSILSSLQSSGLYTQANLVDPVYGDSAYYLGICATTSEYSIFLKLEQDALAQSTTTVSAACEGATALSYGFNYVLNMGSGEGNTGATASAGGESGGGLCSTSWNGSRFIPTPTCTSGGVVGTMSTYAGTGGSPRFIAFDGTNMWGVNFAGKNASRISATGTITNFSPLGAGSIGIAFDGTNMWSANFSSSSISRITSGGTISTYTVAPSPYAIAFDGTNLWVTHYSGSIISKVSLSGTVLATYTD